MNLSVGTSGYSYPKWKGSFYPAKLPTKQMLGYYAERFRAVEINSTFYALPKPATLEAWASEVPAEFRFTLKASQKITHFKRLRDASEPVAALLEVAAVLKERLGPVLYQLPPNMKKDTTRLRDFLALLPPSPRTAFEFRHPSWFDDEVFDLLRERKVALCVAEADDDLEVPFVATADWGYLRLRRAEYTPAALKAWAKRVQKTDWHEAFVFFKHEDTGTGPQFAAQFLTAAGQSV